MFSMPLMVNHAFLYSSVPYIPMWLINAFLNALNALNG